VASDSSKLEINRHRLSTLRKRNDLVFEELGGEVTNELLAAIKRIVLNLADHNDFPIRIASYKKSPLFQNDYNYLLARYIEQVRKIGEQETLVKLGGLAKAHFYSRGEDIELIAQDMIVSDVAGWWPDINFFVDMKEDFVKSSMIGLRYDKNDLVEVDSSFKLEDHGVIYNDKNLVYYHPFLRRYFTSNFVDVPKILQILSKSPDIRLRIALDPLRMTDPKNLKYIIEEDYWYGKYFSKEMLNDRLYEGVTTHVRNIEKKEVLDLSFPLDRTIFYVKNYENNTKEIQIEEIVPIDSRVSTTSQYALQRFAHIIWDMDSQCFTHLDCAVLIYKNTAHAKRFQYDWKQGSGEYPEKPMRKKLFRLDGKVDNELAKDLLNAFFRYNELIEEYLAGGEYQ